jgi:hypothetical protein
LLIAFVVLLCAVLAGSWGWRKSTRKLRRRSVHSDRPMDVGAEDYEAAREANLKRRRLVFTALYSIGGAVLGYGLLLLAVALKPR